MQRTVDFMYKRCVKILKKLRKFINAFNYLFVHCKRKTLSEVCIQIKQLVIEICDIMIEKLNVLERERAQMIKTLKEFDKEKIMQARKLNDIRRMTSVD